MLKEFKEFISRGNVIDLAVAVIIGGAFGAIVTSLVNDIVMPMLGVMLGGINFSGLILEVGEAKIKYGNFLQMTVNFLVVASAMFIVIQAINKFKKTEAKVPVQPVAVVIPRQEQILEEIRDLLKKS